MQQLMAATPRTPCSSITKEAGCESQLLSSGVPHWNAHILMRLFSWKQRCQPKSVGTQNGCAFATLKQMVLH